MTNAQTEQSIGCQCPACRKTLHASDCAVHNAPAYPVGECDCGAQPYPENFIDALTYDVARRDSESAQQEPVGEAYLCDNCHTPFDGCWYCPECNHNTATKELVYTSPPAQRTWVGLTDVEWMNIVNKDQAWFGQRPDEVAHEVAKLIEAKLKEKNT